MVLCHKYHYEENTHTKHTANAYSLPVMKKMLGQVKESSKAEGKLR